MAYETARKAIQHGLAGRRKTPLRGVIAPTLADWLWNSTPDYMPGGLTGRLQWLIGQLRRDGHAVASVRNDYLDRRRTRCPPCYVDADADATTLANWVIGRFLDIMDRYWKDREAREAREKGIEFDHE